VSVFLALFLAHFIADYPMQGEFLAQMKGKNNYLLFCHVMAYTAVIAAVLWFAGVYAIWKIVALIISHFAVDYWKCHCAPKETALTTSLYIDQVAHFIILFLITR